VIVVSANSRPSREGKPWRANKRSYIRGISLLPRDVKKMIAGVPRAGADILRDTLIQVDQTKVWLQHNFVFGVQACPNHYLLGTRPCASGELRGLAREPGQ
jgi:hypothetical protein